MPTISLFYGIKITMYWMDNQQHHTPHYHAKYAEYKASISIETGEMIVGNIPRKKLKLIQAWNEIHREELMANWEAACEKHSINKIEPLK